MDSISSTSTTKCVKCPNMGEFYGLDPKQAVYCKDCFLKMVHHKFSYCLGKHRVFKEAVPENALILYTANKASALLLSLICQGLNVISSKRLRINPSMLFLFTTNDVRLLDLQIKHIRESLRPFRSQGWKLYFVHIAAVLNPHINFSEYADELVGMEEVENFSSLLSLSKDDSLRKEFLRLLQTTLIVRISRKIGCSRVVLPENAEALANISFNALCFGRGSAICGLTAVVDNVLSDVQLIRPLRDICDREIELFHQLHETCSNFTIDSLKHMENLPEFGCDQGGIQLQTANFISSLQKGGFPATVATILSIAAKVVPPSQSSTILNSTGSFTYRNVLEKDGVDCEMENAKRRDCTCEACFTAISSSDNVHYDVNRPQNSDLADENRKTIGLCKPCFCLLAELPNSRTRNAYAEFIKIFKGLSF